MKKSRIISLLLILAVVLLWIFLVGPGRSAIGSLKQEKAQKQEELSQIEKQVQELEEFQARIPDDEASRKLILAQVPQTLEQDRLIRMFDSIASRFGVNFSTMNFSLADELIEGTSTVSISASFQGNFSDLLSFLEAMEEERRIVRVKSLQVERGSDDKATFHLRMEAYFQGTQ